MLPFLKRILRKEKVRSAKVSDSELHMPNEWIINISPKLQRPSRDRRERCN